MSINEPYIRDNLRQAGNAEEVFRRENVFLSDERGTIIGLNLASTHLSDVGFLAGFRYLRYLNLSLNSITDASTLAQLGDLEKIDLSFNQIEDLTFVPQLKKLRYLDLQSNQVRRLPYSFSQLQIPIFWEDLFQLRGVFLDGNPLESPPPEIIQRGPTDIKAYFNALVDGDLPLNELKVIVLGGGRAGKTSLVRRLCGESLRPDEPVTQGINLRVGIAHSGRNIKVHLWDFGGQEIMYSTHAFFMTKRAVYLVVLDGRREETADSWLRLIKILSPGSPVFVIINKLDENPTYDLNRADLRRNFPNIEGFFHLSCLTDQGLDSFLSTFWSRVGEFELPRLRFSRKWLKIKDELLARPEPLLNLSSYSANCIRNQVTDPAEQDALLNCLNDLGLILHFPGYRLGDHIVLKPHWLTDAVYALLADDGAKRGGGIVDRNDVESMINTAQLPRQYAREECRFIIDLMEEFEVCLEIGRDKLLIPDLLSREEPALPDMDQQQSFLVMQFDDFLPLSILHRIVVRLKGDVRSDLLWRTGAIFEDSVLQTSAVVKLEHGNSRLVVCTFGRRRRQYMGVIRKIVRDVVTTTGKIKYAEFLRLPVEQEYLVDYEELIGLREMGIKQYTHGITRRTFGIDALLAAIESNDDDALRVAPTEKRDYDASTRFCFISYESTDRAFVDKLAGKLKLLEIPVWYDRHITGGDLWDESIERHILASSAVVVIVTPESHKSNSVGKELALATQYNKQLIPIQLRAVTDWLLISNVQWISAADETELIADLVASVAKSFKNSNKPI